MHKKIFFLETMFDLFREHYDQLMRLISQFKFFCICIAQKYTILLSAWYNLSSIDGLINVYVVIVFFRSILIQRLHRCVVFFSK